jgi:DNA-binding PadR family transcriptional regulator
MAREKRINVVILGLLSHEDLTGYDIKKHIDNSISFFWNGSFGNIYPALKELEEDNLISSSNAPVGGRERIVYHITQKGKKHLREWIKDEQAVNELRYETLLKLFFAGGADKKDALHNIELFEDKIKKDLSILKIHCKTLKDDLNSEDHMYFYLTALFGVETYEAYIKWCGKAKKLINDKDQFGGR